MDFLKGLTGQKPVQPVADDDFADFAAAPDPSPVSIPMSPADAAAAQPTRGVGAQVPYTKWYRVWERTSPSDFYMEMFLIPIVLLAVLVHFWGVSTNKKKAKKWMVVHQPLLENEFALVGLGQQPKLTAYSEGAQSAAFFETSSKLKGDALAEGLIKAKSGWEFTTYASGRQNVAFADFKVLLKRRMNPFVMIAEEAAGMFFESVKPKAERYEAVIYSFDGNEKNFVPPPIPGTEELNKSKPIGNSTYDGFVFAIVDKLAMRKFRDERYDASLTFTKDNAKLPDWTTVMTESAEITDAMLTKELIEAIKSAGGLFEYLIITDQPTDKPTTIEETTSKKRIHMSVKLPSDGNYLPVLPLFQQFLRLPDHLTQAGRFRSEVNKKILKTREEEKSKLKRVSDKEVEEERAKQLEKIKKEERDRKLKGMSAEEQRKYLDKEAEKNRKKQEKKMQRKG